MLTLCALPPPPLQLTFSCCFVVCEVNSASLRTPSEEMGLSLLTIICYKCIALAFQWVILALKNNFYTCFIFTNISSLQKFIENFEELLNVLSAQSGGICLQECLHCIIFSWIVLIIITCMVFINILLHEVNTYPILLCQTKLCSRVFRLLNDHTFSNCHYGCTVQGIEIRSGLKSTFYLTVTV